MSESMSSAATWLWHCASFYQDSDDECVVFCGTWECRCVLSSWFGRSLGRGCGLTSGRSLRHASVQMRLLEVTKSIELERELSLSFNSCLKRGMIGI